MPTAARLPKSQPVIDDDRPRVVYYPSCASRTMGPAKGDPERDPLTLKTEALLRKAGFAVVYPPSCDALCCGTPFESKGMATQAEAKARQTEQALLAASRQGQDPVVFDTSLCAFRMQQNVQSDRLRLWDITEFIHDELLPRLDLKRLPETVALHATCSTRKMGLDGKLLKIAQACAETVIVPDGVTCCGWAGDKGFTQPELNASAVQDLRTALPDHCRSGYSTSRTCEIGLSLHSDRYYRSIVYLVDRAISVSADPH